MNLFFNIILTILSPFILLAFTIWELINIIWKEDDALDHVLSRDTEGEPIDSLEPPIIK